MKINELAKIISVGVVLGLTACGGGGGGGSNSGGSTPTVADADNDTVEDSADNCPNDANTDQLDSDLDGAGDACDPLPTMYAYSDENGADTVSYTGQTARQVLLTDLVTAMNATSRDAGNVPADVVDDLNYYYSLDAATRDASYVATFALAGGENIIGNDTDAAAPTIAPGAISSDKVVKSKIAGQDSADHILGGEFFGWVGYSTPEELIDGLLAVLGEESADTTDQIAIAGGSANVGAATVTESGLDLRQLIQKVLLGALNFSQGTADYLSIDYGSDANLTLAEGKTYTEGAHDFDEAFGYFGAARNYNDLTDADIRDGYLFAASDSVVVDSAIDLRSEFNFANSTNCAKRDQGTADNTNPTNLTKEIFDAFILGREILQNAAAGATETSAGSLSTEAAEALDDQILIAAQTWEKCIASTVVHYINDVLGDMEDFNGDEFADLDNFLDLAKHWAEMKGFALGLQFSPYSPFRSGEVVVDGEVESVNVDIDDLKQVLSLMGDAPVLADGTQDTTTDNIENGSLYAGAATAAEAKAAYIADLETARDILEQAYAFDTENVANW
ncbi:DUF4856 domain-containing protein [Halioxenophilus aromaticivorans]|uniref:DUF4856 domain-containing protein n=1 Tax=Halioxenophilus aromaticivorans TaxID=1306992 RepID=A0AAV3U7C5_9ALTE